MEHWKVFMEASFYTIGTTNDFEFFQENDNRFWVKKTEMAKFKLCSYLLYFHGYIIWKQNFILFSSIRKEKSAVV